MDTSTIQKSVQQVWSVDSDGNNAQMLSESIAYGCLACGMGLGAGWDAVAGHCAERHSPEGAASTNGGGQSDVTSVSTFHAVELESPQESPQEYPQ